MPLSPAFLFSLSLLRYLHFPELFEVHYPYFVIRDLKEEWTTYHFYDLFHLN